MTIRFDISSQNFDQYFAKELLKITEEGKESLPREIVYKIFKKGHRGTARETVRLSFLAKIYILAKSLRKNIYVVVEDDVNGLNEQEFLAYKKLWPKKSVTIETAQGFVSECNFVLAKKEVSETFNFLNNISGSKHFTYLTKTKNLPPNKTTQWNKEMNYICRFLSYYESNRKRLHINTGVNFSEWLVLLYLYDGELRPSVTIHREWYKYSFNSSSTKLKMAVKTLQTRGYIEKIGSTFKAKVRITTIGRQACTDILSKYCLNC